MKKRWMNWNVGKTFGMATLMLAAVFSACDDDDDNNVVDEIVVSGTDRAFINDASHANRSEIDLGQLATSRTENEGIREYADMIVMEHQQAQSELQNYASGRRVDLSSDFNDQHKALKDTLSKLTGYRFDSAFIMSQVVSHQNSVVKFESYINDNSAANDSRLKDYANKYLPALREHLAHADSLATAMTDTGTNN